MKPKPTMKYNWEYYKNRASSPYLDVLGKNDWCSYFWQHREAIRYAFIRHLVIEFAKNGMFSSSKVSTLGNFRSCLKLPNPGPETYLVSLSDTDRTQNCWILIEDCQYLEHQLGLEYKLNENMYWKDWPCQNICLIKGNVKWYCFSLVNSLM